MFEASTVRSSTPSHVLASAALGLKPTKLLATCDAHSRSRTSDITFGFAESGTT